MSKFIDTVKPYKPLIVIVIVSAVMAYAVADFDAMAWMLRTMGFFLVFLAVFKLFDSQGFQKGFRKYDIITQKIPSYGAIYPFVELGLGLAYIGQMYLTAAYWITLIIMSVGLLGIIRSKRAGQTLKCACMGNILQVPLSTVSIIENGSMILMSAVMLFSHL
jgi:hypothetical protein